MNEVPSALDLPECPPPLPQLDNVYEFDLRHPEEITPVPFSELAFNIPGLATPYVSYDGAINKATKNIDPEKGLLCILYPYLEMATNDFIEVFFGDADIRAASTTVSDIQADGGLSIPLYISEAWLQYGEVSPCFFRVTPQGGNSKETKRFKFFIDDYEPAGPDPDHATPYNEHLDAPKFEPHIVDDGVTPEDATMGVKVFIGKYPNRPGLSPRYNWAARDIIWLLLNGHEIKHSVTEGEASGSDPIVITVYNAKWIDIGSGDVVVQYFVIDEAKNKTVSPSPVTIIQSLIGNPHPLLDAPFIAELNDEGQVDINLLGGDPATLVINVPGRGYLRFDNIEVRAEGYTADGSLVVKHYFGTINSIFVNLHIPIPFADLQALVSGSLRIRFERVRAGETPNRRSRVSVFDVIGSSIPAALPPATILQAPEGNIPADSVIVTVRINAYTGQDPFDRVLLLLIGTYPNGKNYFRSIGPRPAGTGNIIFNIQNGPEGDISKLEGGTLDVRYEVTNEQGTRPSQTANFEVGTLVPSMKPVTIEEAPPPDHVFDPSTSLFGATIIVPANTAFTIGSTVTLYFEGSTPGGSWSKPFPITSLWVGVDLYFDVPREIVMANLNFSATIYYILSKPGERNRLSHAVDMSVGARMALPAAEVLEATALEPGKSATMNPLHVSGDTYPSVFTIRVRYNMLNTDIIQPHFRGKNGAGTPTISPKQGNASAGFVDFVVTNQAVAANVESHVLVNYDVTRGTATHPSDELDLEIQAIPNSALQVVSIPEAPGNQVDAHLSNSVRVLRYPFMRLGQAVWINLDADTDLSLRNGSPVSPAEANAKQINEPIPQSFLLPLPDASDLHVDVRVSLDGTGLISSAQALKAPPYIIKRAKGIIKNIAVGTQPYHIAFNADQSRAYVTNHASHTVSIIDTHSNIVVGTISGFSTPFRLTLHPDGTRLFVGNLGTKTLSVVNTATNTIINTISGFNRIFGITFNETGTRMYVSCNFDAFVYIHDANTYTRLNSLKVIYPTGLAFAPGDARLYAPSQSVITMINPTGNGSLIGDISGTSYPRDIAFSPHNFHAPKAYITNPGLNNNRNTVLVLDSTSNRITKTLTGFNIPMGIAMNPIIERAYISQFGGNVVSIIDTSIDTVIGTLTGFNGPEGIAVTRNGAFAYVCNRNGNSVSVVAL